MKGANSRPDKEASVESGRKQPDLSACGEDDNNSIHLIEQ
jgi:hypothetical protein